MSRAKNSVIREYLEFFSYASSNREDWPTYEDPSVKISPDQIYNKQLEVPICQMLHGNDEARPGWHNLYTNADMYNSRSWRGELENLTKWRYDRTLINYTFIRSKLGINLDLDRYEAKILQPTLIDLDAANKSKLLYSGAFYIRDNATGVTHLVVPSFRIDQSAVMLMLAKNIDLEFLYAQINQYKDLELENTGEISIDSNFDICVAAFYLGVDTETLLSIIRHQTQSEITNTRDGIHFFLNVAEHNIDTVEYENVVRLQVLRTLIKRDEMFFAAKAEILDLT